MGPLWDYHTCYGWQDVATCKNPKGFHVNSSPWYSRLTNDITFDRLIKDHWTQLRKYGVFEDFLDEMNRTIEYISESMIKNYEVWPDGLGLSRPNERRVLEAYDREVKNFRDWAIKRLDWLDEQWYGK